MYIFTTPPTKPFKYTSSVLFVCIVIWAVLPFRNFGNASIAPCTVLYTALSSSSASSLPLELLTNNSISPSKVPGYLGLFKVLQVIVSALKSPSTFKFSALMLPSLLMLQLASSLLTYPFKLILLAFIAIVSEL